MKNLNDISSYYILNKYITMDDIFKKYQYIGLDEFEYDEWGHIYLYVKNDDLLYFNKNEILDLYLKLIEDFQYNIDIINNFTRWSIEIMHMNLDNTQSVISYLNENSDIHKDNGPAQLFIQNKSINKVIYVLNGEEIYASSDEEFKRIIKLKAFK